MNFVILSVMKLYICAVSKLIVHYLQFILLMQYWLCEHTNLIRPGDKVAFPRFARWNLGKLCSKLNKINIQECGKVTTDALIPDDSEILYLKMAKKEKLKKPKKISRKKVEQSDDDFVSEDETVEETMESEQGDEDETQPESEPGGGIKTSNFLTLK